ncbi:MAG: Cytochrome c biosis protein CycY [Verrucomicrobiota bacterium]|jgi:thiol-disulfide isomerase/thioredoxin
MKKTILAIAALALGAVTAINAAKPEEWVGKELPELAVKYLDAKPDIKGKAAIVEFWATWCPPCRKSIPHLNEINKKFKDKGLVIIGVSNEKEDVVTKFRATTPMEYTVALDEKRELGKTFGITGIPHAFIVGKDGKIAWQGHPMQLTDADIEKALK